MGNPNPKMKTNPDTTKIPGSATLVDRNKLSRETVGAFYLSRYLVSGFPWFRQQVQYVTKSSTMICSPAIRIYLERMDIQHR